jgi:hypothetical protein
MKGDFSRDTFDKAKHFSRVLMQQGRVQLDSDWNEQSAILLHYLRTLAAELIGPFAGPSDKDGKPRQDFKIGIQGSPINLTIGPGRYYVDGILCENDKSITYGTQEDFPNPPQLNLEEKKIYVVYLDVWERHITVVEDDSIREKALGGPDTASRAKVIWQVKFDVAPDVLSKDNIKDKWQSYIERWQPLHLGCLKARVKQPTDSTDPCLTAPEAKYRGTENQLYRVEIHTGSDVGATFKWSRENGAIVTGCRKLSDTEWTFDNIRGFAADQWVELINEGQELRGEPGTLVKLLKVESDVVTLVSAPSPANTLPKDEIWPTKVRRWDQHEKQGIDLASDQAVPIRESKGESNWFDLEDGIQIQFQPPQKDKAHHYRTGDYWLIPARTATGYIEWPEVGPGDPKPQSPHGIRHHYAPLSILTINGTTWEASDCRCGLKPANSCTLESYGEDGMGGAPAECPTEEGVRVTKGSLGKRAVSSTRKPQVKRPKRSG